MDDVKKQTLEVSQREKLMHRVNNELQNVLLIGGMLESRMQEHQDTEGLRLVSRLEETSQTLTELFAKLVDSDFQ